MIPSEETREIYHEAIKSNNDHILTIEMLQTQLQEKESAPGALICEYDFFRVLHYSMARSVLRNGIAVHMVLLSISGKRDAELSVKKREKVMANMEEVIRDSLRRGDAAARCSATQYVIMLPCANYENSCLVCDRILREYYHKFSKMDAEKVASCIQLIRDLGFQAIISATNDKIQNYVENVNKTFVITRIKITNQNGNKIRGSQV